MKYEKELSHGPAPQSEADAVERVSACIGFYLLRIRAVSFALFELH